MYRDNVSMTHFTQNFGNDTHLLHGINLNPFFCDILRECFSLISDSFIGNTRNALPERDAPHYPNGEWGNHC